MPSPTFWAGTGRGFRRSSRHSDVTCPKTVLWKIPFFFSKELQEGEPTHFFFGGLVGQPKRNKVAMPSLPEFSAWSATKWWEIFNLERNVPNLSRILCVFASRKTVFKKNRGVPIFPNIFCLIKHWWFPFRYWFGGGQEVGVLESAIGIATDQLSQVRESLKGAESCSKLLEIPIMKGIQKSRITCRIWLWSDYYIEIKKTFQHWTINHSF